ncbi:MAG TPA: glycerophosphodiester phosphodiesterase family protein [Clostridiales bacterium]|nr:glycerophosphodiester phosphodiesterase family protein [Clostridiales bacterium]
MAIIVKKQTSGNKKNIDKKDMEQHIYWQAHQSTSTVMPENTMAAFMYAWELGGIPEADIRTTSDGVIICMHDSTPARTTDAPDSQRSLPVSSFTLEQVKKWDAGIKTGELYRGEMVPALKEAFEVMKQKKDRLLYLDLKEVDLGSLGKLINEYGVNNQIIFTHYNEDNCRQMYKTVEDIKTMLWIGGTPDKIKGKFNKVLSENFYGLNQIQIHLYSRKDNKKDNKKDSNKDSNEDNNNDSNKGINKVNNDKVIGIDYDNKNSNMALTCEEWPYEIDKAFLEYAYDKTLTAGLDLEVLPFEFDDSSIHTILNIGIRWFAVDFPERFISSVKKWEDKLTSK